MSRTPTQQLRYEERRKAYENGSLLPIEEKWCKMCDEVKSHKDFYLRFDLDTLLSHYCRKCHVKDNVQYKKRVRAHATHS